MKEFGEIYDQAHKRLWPGYLPEVQKSINFFNNLSNIERVLYSIVLTNIQGFVCDYRYIRHHTGLSKKEASGFVKTMLGQGIIERSYYGDYDYRVAGSGFCYLNWK